MTRKISSYDKANLSIQTLLVLGISIGFYGSIFRNLQYLKIINEIICHILTFSLSIISTITCFILLCIDLLREEKEYKFLFYFKKILPKLLLWCFIFSFFLSSIRYELLWTVSETKEVLTLIWTMFSLAVTIFLIWKALIVEFLKRKAPQDENKNENDYIKKYQFLLRKQDYVNDIERAFLPLILIVLNLLLILFATTSIYISKQAETLLTQNVIIFAFYFTTNTLVSLFLDIFKSVKFKEQELINEHKVTFEDMHDSRFLANVQNLKDELKFLLSADKLKEMKNRSDIEKSITGLEKILNDANNGNECIMVEKK